MSIPAIGSPAFPTPGDFADDDPRTGLEHTLRLFEDAVIPPLGITGRRVPSRPAAERDTGRQRTPLPLSGVVMTSTSVPVPVPASSRSGRDAWRRGVRLLERLRLRPLARPPAPVRPPRAAQVRALLAVLEEAVAVQRPADAAVAACGAPGPVPGQTARACNDAGSALLRLRARLLELPLADADLVRAQAYAGRLLSYHQWMVRQSADLAYRVHADARTEAARLQVNGLGRPADELRRLRDALREGGTP
ncbi:hypothetical protein [Streptomyces sp. NPDC058291]|uniref:hypothetical protein n=1 Tax=Streptomyces sp. NPDC058291 TaxID=3346427 RepID=UPI0036E3E08D